MLLCAIGKTVLEPAMLIVFGVSKALYRKSGGRKSEHCEY